MLLKGACDAGFDLLGDPDRVEIGHAGYEVDDNHILRAAPVFILRRDELPIRVEVPVEGPYDLLGRLTEDTPRLGDIDCLEYEIAKLVECGSDLVAHGDHGMACGVGLSSPDAAQELAIMSETRLSMRWAWESPRTSDTDSGS